MPKEEANGRIKILARARQTGLLLRGKLMPTRFKFFNSSPAGIWEESYVPSDRVAGIMAS